MDNGKYSFGFYIFFLVIYIMYLFMDFPTQLSSTLVITIGIFTLISSMFTGIATLSSSKKYYKYGRAGFFLSSLTLIWILINLFMNFMWLF